MLTVERARMIATQWRPQFQDEDSFEASWSRFFEMVGDPTAEKLHNWLAKDQAKDAIRHAGIVSEPLLPTRSRFAPALGECPVCGGDPQACPTCHGLGYVRRDVSIDHPHFGKALRCPTCTHG